MIIIIIIIVLLWRAFHANVRWWFLSGVSVTASFHKCPGILSVFWSIVIMLKYWWSLLVLLFSSLPVPSVVITIGITVTYMFYIFFQFSSKILVLISLFAFFKFYSLVCKAGFLFFSLFLLFFLFIHFFFFFFFFGYHKVWSSGRDLVICLYLKITENFVRFILLDELRIMHLLFVRILNSLWITFPKELCLVLNIFR